MEGKVGQIVKNSERYLLQWRARKGYTEWVTVDHVAPFKSAADAEKLATDRRRSPVPPNSEWRVVRSVLTYEVVSEHEARGYAAFGR